MKTLALAVTLGALCCATAASADQASANKCAAGLSAQGQQIYAASAPQVTPGADLRGIITAQTKSMVMSGAMSRDAAKPAAEAAGKCLKLLQS